MLFAAGNELLSSDPGTETVTDAPTDQELIAAVLDGEPAGADELVRRYGTALRHVLLRGGAPAQDVDDLLQETWIRVIRSAASYDPLQPFSRWLFTIAMNRFRTRAVQSSKSAKKHEPLEEHHASVSSTAASAHALLESEERASRVRAVIASLPPRLADAVLLRYFEELSEKEIAATMGVPLGTVKSRLHTALGRLRADFERNQT